MVRTLARADRNALTFWNWNLAISLSSARTSRQRRSRAFRRAADADHTSGWFGFRERCLFAPGLTSRRRFKAARFLHGGTCGSDPQVSALFWLKENWPSLLEGIGIIGGLIFTAVSLRRDTRSRRVSDLLTLTEQHRNLWSEVHERDGLRRIYEEDVDLVAGPITDVEEEFLNRVIVHFNTGWLLAREGSLLTLETLASDVRWFFNLPVPRRVWEATKEGRDRRFIQFVETSLKQRPRNQKQ